MAKFVEIMGSNYRVDGITEVTIVSRNWGHKSIIVNGGFGVYTIPFSKDQYDAGLVDAFAEYLMREAS